MGSYPWYERKDEMGFRLWKCKGKTVLVRGNTAQVGKEWV
jgi:hypothetical protein